MRDGVRQGLHGLCAICLFLVLLPSARGQTNSWVLPDSGKWETNANWSLGSAPGAGQNVFITNDTTKTVTIDAITAGFPGTMTVGSLDIGGPLFTLNTLFLSNAGTITPFKVTGLLTIGGNGELVVNGSLLVAGALNDQNEISIEAGTLTLLGAGGTLTESITVSGGGALVLSGATNWTLSGTVALAGGASGGSLVASNSGSLASLFLDNPGFRDNDGLLAVLGGQDINYGQIGSDMTNDYIITGSGSLTGVFGGNNNAILNRGTISSLAGLSLVLDPRDAFDLGGVFNATNGTIVVAPDSTLTIRRTDNAWTNVPFAEFPANSGTILMQSGTLAGQTVTNNTVASFYINNATGLIDGCGTLENFATVVNNGTIQADCGGTLTFSGAVTNNGVMRALNGTVIEAYGTVVNNGTIDVTAGSADFHTNFVNHGTFLSQGGSFQITAIVRQTNDILLTWSTVGGRTNIVQAVAGGPGGGYSTNFTDLSPPIAVAGSGAVTTNYLDSGGATNGPARYYRVRNVP